MLLRHQEGFSLIEAVTALGILTVGLLGLSAMQDMSITRNMDANELTVVTNLSADMMDRIQFNWRKVKLAAVGGAGAYTNLDTQNIGTRPPITEPQARGDYDQWQVLLNNSVLRNVRGQVFVAQNGATDLDQYTVTVQVTWAGTQASTLFTRPRTMTMQTLMGPE